MSKKRNNFANIGNQTAAADDSVFMAKSPLLASVEEELGREAVPVSDDTSESSETPPEPKRSSNMAISMSKYVDISSTFPEGSIADRSFGGLVFTPSAMLPDADATTKATYDGGDRVGLSLSEVANCFGEESNEYKFALGYYSYSSPTGTYASRLSFAFVKEGESPVAAFERIRATFDMFGSFTFLNGQGDGARVFTQEELVAAAGANNAKHQFLFVVNVKRGTKTAAAIVELKKDFELNSAKGCCFVCGADEWSGYMPMAIFAATNFDNGIICDQMFRQFPGETPSVNGDDEYETLKNGGVNFYGRTQCNGQTFDFYQRGINTNGTDTSVFCNELWFKSSCAKNLLNYLVNSGRIPANQAGCDLVKTRVLEICDDAVANGSFMPKEVSPTDQASIKMLISQKGGSAEESQSIIFEVGLYGYSVWTILDTKDGDYICHYYVFYGTGDSIKMIVGDDILLK